MALGVVEAEETVSSGSVAHPATVALTLMLAQLGEATADALAGVDDEASEVDLVDQIGLLERLRGAVAAGVRCYLVTTRPEGVGFEGRTGENGVDSLSEREVEVLQHVADGRSNKDTGALLGLSALTVKSHLARIARKLGTGDRAEMVAITLRAGVIQ